ncbi:unnamed protein product [Ilex paraguariensis]|uniref:Protein NIM1-INTERACTING 1 n=1 Tax=Ilex paraguariensis TaxID=185542 RepID=A0ABC8RRG8_9AQUA
MENEKTSVRKFNAFKLAEDQNDLPEPEPEEEKMEKFFALIKSFNDARNRRRNELMIINEMEKKKNKRKRPEVDLQQSSWVPSFKWEDFTEEIEFRRPPLIFPDPCNSRQVQKDQQDCLDLNLTL